MSELICPNCGSRVVLPENESVVTGVTLSKNSDNNTYYLNVENGEKKIGKVTERINALKNAGVDMSGYFSFVSPDGNEMLFKQSDDGSLTSIDINELDDISTDIYANGYVKNTKLHRRWIMAQMFRAIDYDPYWSDKKGFIGWLESHGYEYQWKMITEEVRVLSKLQDSDKSAFEERSKFFTKKIIVGMLNDYIAKLVEYVNNSKTYSCKGIPYKKVRNYGDVFVEDLNKKIYFPLYRIVDNISNAYNYKDIYYCLIGLKALYSKLPWDTKLSSDFVDAYKASGAFYTLKNMVMFHDCKIENYGTGSILDKYKSIEYLNNLNAGYEIGNGYKLFALLKRTIEVNNFDFNERMIEINS